LVSRIIGIFHVNVHDTKLGKHHPSVKRVDFFDGSGGLLVTLQLHVQLIPAFRFGHTSGLLGSSIAHRESDNNKDWDWYYVNM